MIQVVPQMRVLVAIAPADFRRGIDALARTCRQALGADPFSGTLFVFRNRRGSALKVLVYDGQGFWLCHKRLSAGRLRWWPSSATQAAESADAAAASADSAAAPLQAHELQVLLYGGDPSGIRAAPPWRCVETSG